MSKEPDPKLCKLAAQWLELPARDRDKAGFLFASINLIEEDDEDEDASYKSTRVKSVKVGAREMVAIAFHLMKEIDARLSHCPCGDPHTRERAQVALMLNLFDFWRRDIEPETRQ